MTYFKQYDLLKTLLVWAHITIHYSIDVQTFLISLKKYLFIPK